MKYGNNKKNYFFLQILNFVKTDISVDIFKTGILRIKKKKQKTTSQDCY